MDAVLRPLVNAGVVPLSDEVRYLLDAVGDIDVISDSLVDQVLAHDETGAKLCGWKP